MYRNESTDKRDMKKNKKGKTKNEENNELKTPKKSITGKEGET